MFEMNADELENWRTQIATSDPGGRIGLRYAPFCFSEHGVLMLSSVLNSAAATAVNIQIIRVFTRMREMLFTHKDILLQLEKLNGLTTQQGQDIRMIIEQLRRMREKEENRLLLAQIAKAHATCGAICSRGVPSYIRR